MRMSVISDVRAALQDTLAPEIRELKVRVENLEVSVRKLDSKMDENERRAEKRHGEVLSTARDAIEINRLAHRVAKVEARLETEKHAS